MRASGKAGSGFCGFKVKERSWSGREEEIETERKREGHENKRESKLGGK